MKKLTSILLALLMALTLLPTAVFAETTTATALPTAENGVYTINSDANITLTENVTGSIVIASGNVTLNLNGKNITNEATGKHTITVKYGATLTITGNGKVDNKVDKGAALLNNGTARVDGGTYLRSSENGVYNGNTFYNIQNHGVMTISAGVEVTQSGNFSSMVQNGYYSYSSDYESGTNHANPELTINGGTFSGGLNTIKNDDGGKLTITGGTFKNFTQSCVQNHHYATIDGGSYVASNSTAYAVVNCGSDTSSCGVYDQDKHEITINGGSFTGNVMQNHGTVTINDGTFIGEINKVGSATLTIKGGAFSDLADAITYVASGSSISLAADANDIGNIFLPANVTLDGNNHTISGTSCVFINAAGGTVKNVKFSNIHNSEKKASPLYSHSLTGTATITGCTFSGSDWDSIQIVPLTDAVINITGNEFTSSSKRYVHIEADGRTQTSSKCGVDFSATVTGNKFLNVKDLTSTGLEVYWAKNASKLKLNGNYMDAPMAVCIGVGDNYSDYNNSYYLSFPFVDKDGKNVTPVAMAYDSSKNTKLYLTMEDALNDTASNAYYVYGNVTENISITRGVTLDMGGKTLTGNVDVTAGKTLTVKNGRLAITGGTFSGKLVVGEKGAVTVTGGMFAFNPAEYVNDTKYVVTKVADSEYTVGASTGTSSVVLPTTGGSESSTSTSANIPASDIDENKELVVGTGTTSVTFNSTAAASIKTKGDLTLTVTTKDGKNSDNVTDTNKAAYTEAAKSTSTTNAVVVSIDLKDNDGKNVFTDGANGAYAIVTVPYKTGMKNVTVHHLGANGAVTKLGSAASADLKTNDTFYYDSTTGVITMRLPHFSQYLINGTVSSSYVKRWDSSAATTNKAQSPTTFDAGIAVYGVMAVSSVLGMGYMGKKKFF